LNRLHHRSRECSGKRSGNAQEGGSSGELHGD
jgi:hypothetical protein